MSRDVSGGKQKINFAITSNRGRVYLYSLKTKRRFNGQAKCSVRVSTRFTSLLLAVGTSMVATASKKGKIITSTHNLPLSFLR